MTYNNYFLLISILLISVACQPEKPMNEVNSQEDKAILEEAQASKEVFTKEPIIEMDTTESKEAVPVNPEKVVTKDECTIAYQKLKKLVEAYKTSKSKEALQAVVKFRREPSTVKCSENPAYADKFKKLLEG